MATGNGLADGSGSTPIADVDVQRYMGPATRHMTQRYRRQAIAKVLRVAPQSVTQPGEK